MSTDYNRYRVLLTPLVKANTYGTTVDVTQDVDVSDWIADGGIGETNRELDEGDYQFASQYVFGDVKLLGLNHKGRWSGPEVATSYFPYSRDLAKVEIQFQDRGGTYSTIFRGVTNEEATRENVAEEAVEFSVLSLDSVLRKNTVSSGALTNGMLFSAAIKALINVPRVTTVLTYSAANINVDLDLAVDDASAMENLTTWDALQALLAAANSVLYVNDSGAIIVKSRTDNGGSAVGFYGPQDMFGRENIISISSYNTGLHRAFNSVVVNGEVASESDYSDKFGARMIDFTFGFVTSTVSAGLIAARMLREFKAPKIEFILEVSANDAEGLDLLDLALVDYGPQLRPANGDKLPVYGAAVYGADLYPVTIGSFRIPSQYAFKIIGIKKIPASGTAQIKLRQTGITLSDGLFSSATVGLYGTAIYGTHTYA